MLETSGKRVELTPGPGKSVEKTPAPFNWKSLPVELLIQYRDEITQCLPAVDLAGVDLEQELMLQYRALRALQSSVLTDESLPLNQRAQVANTVGATLDRLIDAQEKVYNQERFKSIETLLIRHLKRLPENLAGAFLHEYAQILREK